MDSRSLARVGFAGVVGAAALLSWTATTPAQAAMFKCGKTGGDLVFAQDAQVAGLDQHFSTAISTRNIATHLYESLMTRGENNAVVPLLAESYSESDDGLTYSFKLRSGITFHNGKPMTSKDVLASTIRFAKISADRGTFSSLDRFETPDDGTFVVKLTKRIPVFIEEFSSFRVPIAIHPADGAVKDAGKLGKTVGAGDLEAIEVTPGGKIDYVGTGPFEFVEWAADSHVKMKRFEGYKARTDFDNRTGFGGHKVACLDTVTFRIVKESGARVAGIETGELDAADTIPPKAAQRLKDNKGIKFLTLENWWLQVAFINHQRVPTNDLKIRRAIQIGLNMEEIMEIATDGNYNLQPGYQYPGNPYYTNAGKEYYNKADVAQAKKLIKEAGYKGEEIVLLTNSDYTTMYNAALVMTEQLKAMGLGS